MSASPSPSASRPLAVLVVENHADTLKYLRMYLEHLGHAVRTAGTLAKALEQLAAAPCDVLISDIGLPDGDGWDLLKRAQLRTPVYAIAMSGFGMGSDRSRSRAAGFRHHLLKPFTPEQLDGYLQEAQQEHDAGQASFSEHPR
jgi:two-component system CheB/CheR fusion protein